VTASRASRCSQQPVKFGPIHVNLPARQQNRSSAHSRISRQSATRSADNFWLPPRALRPPDTILRSIRSPIPSILRNRVDAEVCREGAGQTKLHGLAGDTAPARSSSHQGQPPLSLRDTGRAQSVSEVIGCLRRPERQRTRITVPTDGGRRGRVLVCGALGHASSLPGLAGAQRRAV
jgi:hypothetical protein